MSKYKVIIKRIEPKRNHGYRYEVIVHWDGPGYTGGISGTSWSHTRWGARREARRIIRKHELPKEKQKVVEEYTL